MPGNVSSKAYLDIKGEREKVRQREGERESGTEKYPEEQ